MSSTLKIYVLALVSFLVGTSEYVIAGILDRIADTMNISLIAAGQAHYDFFTRICARYTCHYCTDFALGPSQAVAILPRSIRCG